jgi:hypothetical protein
LTVVFVGHVSIVKFLKHHVIRMLYFKKTTIQFSFEIHRFFKGLICETIIISKKTGETVLGTQN